MHFCHCMLVTVLLILQPDSKEPRRIYDRPGVPSKPDMPSPRLPYQLQRECVRGTEGDPGLEENSA